MITGLIIAIVVIGLIIILSNVSEEKREKARSSSEKTVVKSSVPGIEPKSAASTSRIEDSLDEIYAREHDAWICRYCETMNGNVDNNCKVCGKKRE